MTFGSDGRAALADFPAEPTHSPSQRMRRKSGSQERQDLALLPPKTDFPPGPNSQLSARTSRRPWWSTLLPFDGGSTFRHGGELVGNRCATVRGRSPSRALPPLRQQSVHARWARRIREEQHKWYRASRRSRMIRTVKQKPPWKNAANTDSAQTADWWGCTLRANSELDGPPRDWQERKHQSRRKFIGLQRLQMRQTQWRAHQPSRRSEGEKTICKEIDPYWYENDETVTFYEPELDERKDSHRSLASVLTGARERSVESSNSSFSSGSRASPSMRGSNLSQQSGTRFRTNSDSSSDEIWTADDDMHQVPTEVRVCRLASPSSSDCKPLSNRTSACSTRWPSSPSSKRSSVNSKRSSANRSSVNQLPAPFPDFVTCSSSKRSSVAQWPTSVQDDWGDIQEEEDGDADTPPEQLCISLRSLEDWRTEFSLEKLDRIASIYLDLFVDSSKHRIMSRTQFEKLTEEALNVPPQFSSEVWQRRSSVSAAGSMPPLVKPELQSLIQPLRCRCFLDILELCHRVQTQVQLQDPLALWDKIDILNLHMALSQHRNSSGSISPERLLGIMTEMGAKEALTIAGQRIVSEVVQSVMQVKTFRGKKTRSKTLCGPSGYSDHEVSEIISRSFREFKRMALKKDLEDEKRVRTETGFSFLETEELRELYRAYLECDTIHKDSKDCTQRFAAFLSQCGVGKLAPDDTATIRGLISQSAITEDRAGTFAQFVQWMHAVFSKAIGGLSRSSIQTGRKEVSENEISNLRSFARVVIQENDMCEALLSKLSGKGPKETNPNVMPEGGHGCSADDGQDGQSSVDSSQSFRSTRRGHARNGRHTVVDGTKMGVFQSAVQKSVAAQRLQAGSSNFVVFAKGLPPSEAMLSRREIRACSIDLGSDSAQMQFQGLEGHGAGALRKKFSKAGTSSHTVPEATPKRKVKTAMDSSLIVQSAISRLEMEIDGKAGFEDDVEAQD